MVSVRQASALLTASFGFGLATDTLAVRLALPLAGCALDFNQLVSAPCRAHKAKGPKHLFRPFKEKLAATYSRGVYKTTTIGKTVFDGRVRNGNGSDHSFMATKKRR